MNPGEDIWFGSVAKRAKDYGLRVYAPTQINDSEWVEVIRACGPDILFSFYYRKLVSAKILAIPPAAATTCMAPCCRAFADVVLRIGQSFWEKRKPA